MAPQCSALNVSDEVRCQREATTSNGLFCAFHGKQCQGLYKGYKRRNARLDALSPPTYLADNSVPLANQNFVDIESQATLDELHKYLFTRYALLDRVIRARKLHHSRFYSLNLDYGHQHYLDDLQNQRFIVLRALGRLERRRGDVLFKEQKWFNWIRDCQDEEESQKDKESVKVKREAAFFKRHQKEVELRMKKSRDKERARQQDVFLEQAYQERLAQLDDDEDWDPIEDVVENERANFLDLIRHFLWQDAPTKNEGPTESGGESKHSIIADTTIKSSNAQRDEHGNGLSPSERHTSIANSNIDQSESVSGGVNNKKGKKKPQNKTPVQEPIDKTKMETRAEMRKRLQEGSKVEYKDRPMLFGTFESPVYQDRTYVFPDAEIDQLLEEVHEIKHLLFCRLLLSHATLLPAAVRAKSVEEFMNDAEISTADLRDLCLKMEQPRLQDIRDACADLVRGDDEEEDNEPAEDDVDDVEDKKGLGLFPPKKRDLPAKWSSERERRMRGPGEAAPGLPPMDLPQGAMVEFGQIESGGKSRKVQIRICGRHIYNYPSEKAMSRGGWLHFSIIAKNSTLNDSIELCRSWEEFYQLNILSLFGYFSAPDWLSSTKDRGKQQMLQLGFATYFTFEEAEKLTKQQQTGSRGGGRRQHAYMEARNFVCAHMNRNDTASQRFIQYLSMEMMDCILLVRDAKTSKIVLEPHDDDLWLIREKSGIGRASKTEWNVVSRVGEGFFDEMEKHREWHFGFTDYYDVYVWDRQAGRPFLMLYNLIKDLQIKANRVRSGVDLYSAASPVLKSITRDPVSCRVRAIRTGEDVQSLWDALNSGGNKFMWQTGLELSTALEEAPKGVYYNDADQLEDEVLFNEDSVDNKSRAIIGPMKNALRPLENGDAGKLMERFCLDLDTDDEFDDEDWDVEEETDDEDGGDNNGDTLEKQIRRIWKRVNDSKSTSPKDEDNVEEDTGNVDRREMMRPLKKWDVGGDFNGVLEDDMDNEMIQAEFEEYMDRVKAKAFKDAFHKADLTQKAQERYTEMNDLIKTISEHQEPKSRPDTENALFDFHLIDWLEQPNAHGRVHKDMRHARNMMNIFFPTNFWDSKAGLPLKDSLLVKQVERAKNVPERRTHHSVKYRPSDFYKDIDAVSSNRISKQAPIVEVFPEEWDLAIRPIIARLFKEGIIGTTKYENVVSQAFVARDLGPSSPYDLHIDYRKLLEDVKMPHFMKDPTRITTAQIRARANNFAKSNPDARFAVLRIWSAAHFYPLMIGIDQREVWSFTDGVGRTWEWKFVPKDMPESEWSIHYNVGNRLQPFDHHFGHRIMVRRDLVLVMGSNEPDLKEMATAVTFAIQTRPWRLEVDLWRSFVNVDRTFLEGLDDGWLE